MTIQRDPIVERVTIGVPLERLHLARPKCVTQKLMKLSLLPTMILIGSTIATYGRAAQFLGNLV